MGIIEAHPGSFALRYKNQLDNTGVIIIKINRIESGLSIPNKEIFKLIICLYFELNYIKIICFKKTNIINVSLT